MGTKQKPSQFDGYAKALPDEPMFVLLARDPSAPWRVNQWAGAREEAINQGDRPESDRAVVEEARQCARDMASWRLANEGRWRKQEPAPLTREQAIERLQWLATGNRGAVPDWLPVGGWDDGIRDVAAAALALIPTQAEGGVNHDTLKAMVFTDRYEDEPAADPDRGNPVEEEPLQQPLSANTRNAMSYLRGTDYGRTSQAAAMAERQQQAGVPLEEEQMAAAEHAVDNPNWPANMQQEEIERREALMKRPLSPSALLLPEVKP